MTWSIVVLAVTQALATAVLAAVLVRRTARPSTSLTGSTVVLTTPSDDRTYRGVVVADHADRLVLRDVLALVPEGERAREVPMAGLLYVDRADCSAVQRLTDRG